MFYLVIKPFRNLDGSFLQIGDKIDCDFHRAAVLRRNGLIGNIAESKLGSIPENNIIETAEEKPTKRKYRKRNQPESTIEKDND